MPAVTIATPLRIFSTGGRPVIAQEDLEASRVLANFLNTLDIRTTFAHIPPTGEIDFRPEALVLICGPKSSSVVRSIIQDDPLLDFDEAEPGIWRIHSRENRQQFRSPIDDDAGANQDFAYLARLPRPTSAPTFLLIAGIHAIGSLGAVHYLTQAPNLHALHRSAGTGPFSAVISSTFTRSPLQILSSEAMVGPQLHVRN